MTFEFVMVNPNAEQEGRPPYRFASFTVNQDEADKMLHNVEVMTTAIRELAVITKMPADSDLSVRVRARVVALLATLRE